MAQMTEYDVLVVGAGPAGAGMAALLAAQGRRVLLLEKERFPRYKACAGGIDGVAVRALASMGIDAGPVVQDAPTELCVTSGGRYPAVYRFERPLALMVMRSDFDTLIARSAVARGAEFHDGEPVKTVLDDGRMITVTTAKGRYQGRTLVGADGVYSVVARTFGLNPNPILYVLAEAEVEVSAEVQASWAGRAQIDISVWPLGYSWIFPKRSHLSIGTGAPRRYAKQLALRFEQFSRSSHLENGAVLQQRSHMLGFRRRQAPLALDRVLLVGDAAGLVDPNTGGGIGWALRSAQLASAAILSYLGGDTRTLGDYTKLIDAELEPEFRAARVLRNGIILRFILTGGRATRHSGLWNQVARILRAEECYQEWYTHSRLAKWLAWTGAIPL